MAQTDRSVGKTPDARATASTDIAYHDRRLAQRLRDDPAFRVEFERQQREIAAADANAPGA